MFTFYVLLEGKWEWVADVFYMLRAETQKMLEELYGPDAVKWEVKEETHGTDD